MHTPDSSFPLSSEVRMRLLSLSLTCAVTALVALATGGAEELTISPGPMIAACPANGPIRLDGSHDDRAWDFAVVASEMHRLGSQTAAAQKTTFRFLYTDDALLLGVECQLGARKRLLPKPKAKGHDGPVYGDESVELYLQPVNPGPYYHLAVNITGVRYDGRGMDRSWDGAWEARTTRKDQSWFAEVRVPFKIFGFQGPPKPGVAWRFNLTRNDRIHQQYNTWAVLQRGFHEPEGFGRLRFSGVSAGAGPAQLHRSGNDVKADLAARSGPKLPVEIRAAMTVRTPAGQFDFQPGQKLGPEKSCVLSGIAPGAWSPNASAWFKVNVQAGTELLYVSPAVTIPATAIRPLLSSKPSPVTIGNEEVSLTFDRSTGRLLSAKNKSSGLEVAFGKSGVPIIELDAVRFIRNPRFFREEDVETIVPDYETLSAVERREDARGQTLEILHTISGSISLELSVTVPPKGVETEWNLELKNPLTHQPSRSLVIHRVRYPDFSDLPEDLCGEAPHVILPTLMGQKIPEPGKNLGSRRKVSYISYATMGWFDFYGSEGGLYLKVGDVDPLPQTELLAQSDPQGRRLHLAIQRWALCWPGQTWKPGPCGLAIHRGDWHRAADLYRSWFRKSFKIRKPPDWLKEADGYVMSGGPNYEFADFPRIIENAKAIGIKYVQLWSEMTGGELSYHAFAFPNPYMGTEKDLTQAIADLHEKGGHIGFYLNFNTGDPLLGTFVRQPRLAQKIPRDIPRPALDFMKDNWVQQSLMSHRGNYSTWSSTIPGYLDGYWNTCPASKKWTDFYAWWVTEKWAKEYGADVWYLDSCPVSRGSPCFAFDHGHARPVAEGQSIINFYKRLRADAPDDFTLMQEYSSDRLLPYTSHALGLMWHRPFSHPEVVRYTLPEYPLFSGLCNSTRGVQQFYPDEKVDTKDPIERVFLIGNRFEFFMSNRPPEMASEWQRKMVRLRRACRPEMNHGDFLDNIGLGPLPEDVEARLFRRADRGRLVVTLLDRRKDNREPLQLQLDLKAAGVSPGKSAALMTLDGELPLESPQRVGNGIVITVPPYEGRPAAVMIETRREEQP